jgi:hypothetical protein
VNNCWITLGAYGDIMNTLPLVLNDLQSGNSPSMMVASEFESILDGVSYCNRISRRGHYSESSKAVEEAVARDVFDNIYLVQCYGTNIDRYTDSYAKESWRLVGKMDLWGKLPLVFDRRNSFREAGWIPLDNSKPLVLVATKGKSSPFEQGPDLAMSVALALQDTHTVLNLDLVNCDRIYDLLGLMERASCLIATDSAPLHLSYAVPSLPVIALVTPYPDLWHGSPRRPNHIAYIRYNEYYGRKGDIIELARNPKSIVNSQPKLIHVWSEYSRFNAGAVRRHEIARATWMAQYDRGGWIQCPVEESTMQRNANTVGEPKPVPFVKDLIEEAALRGDPGDVIVFTNDDTCMAPNLADVIRDTVSKHGALWGSRWEHRSVPRPMNLHEMVRGAYRHVGADVFAFTVEWWNLYRHDFPDFLLSFEAWDLVLKKLILITKGVEVQDTCYHEIHQSFWHTEANRNCTGNLYNRELTRQWLASHGIRWEDAFK